MNDFLDWDGGDAGASYRACRRVLFVAIAAGGANLEMVDGLARTGLILAIGYSLISMPRRRNTYAA